MKYLFIMLMSLSLLSCSEKTVIVQPEEDIVIDCSWLILNYTEAWGVNMKETPNGTKVYRMSGIFYHKTENFFETYNLSGEKDIYNLTEYDVVEYEEYTE